MQLSEINDWLERIERSAKEGHPAAAHIQEDRLYREVLEAIAATNEPIAVLAATALLSQDVDFPRWADHGLE